MKKLIALLLLASNVAFAGSAMLSWTAPTQNEDATPLTDLAGYKIYYGKASGNYTDQVRIDNPGVTTYVVDNLTPDTYYFVATAYNEAGTESAYSSEAVKDIVGGSTIPNPPTGLTVSANLTAFSVIKVKNAFVLLAVGTVPAGTECDSAQSVNGHNAVDRNIVQMTQGGEAPYVVVANCT